MMKLNQLAALAACVFPLIGAIQQGSMAPASNIGTPYDAASPQMSNSYVGSNLAPPTEDTTPPTMDTMSPSPPDNTTDMMPPSPPGDTIDMTPPSPPDNTTIIIPPSPPMKNCTMAMPPKMVENMATCLTICLNVPGAAAMMMKH